MTRAEPLFAGDAVQIERDAELVVRDGVTLRADVYRPLAPGPHPVLLMRTPYDKRQAMSNLGYAHPSWYARNGYLVVIQDCRGRGRSDGRWYYDREEPEDGYETVEWAARLPGSNGRVGMYGFSYVGYTQLLAAITRPPSLAAIAPAFTYGQGYDVIYDQGAMALGIALPAAMFHAYQVAEHDGDYAAYEALIERMRNTLDSFWELPLRDVPALRDVHAPWFGDWVDNPSYGEYWESVSVAADFARVDVPALHIGGWYDICVTDTVRSFTALQQQAGSAAARSAQKLLIGPWYHMPWTPLGGASTGDASWRAVDDWQLRWFDQHLKDRDTGVLDAPVTAYVMGDGWRDLDGWPPADRKRFYLRSNGRANAAGGDGTLSEGTPAVEPPDVFVYDPAAPNMPAGGHSCCWPEITPMGPACQCEAESTKTVLVYTGEPLEYDVELVGSVSVELYAASSALDTDFTARLCVVDEAGCSRNVQEGIVRARYRDSLTAPTLIEPGKVYRYGIELGPVGLMVRKGQRIRVDVASADFPQWDRNLNTGGRHGYERLSDAVLAIQAVLHDGEHPSCVLLPWRPLGGEATA